MADDGLDERAKAIIKEVREFWRALGQQHQPADDASDEDMAKFASAMVIAAADSSGRVLAILSEGDPKVMRFYRRQFTTLFRAASEAMTEAVAEALDVNSVDGLDKPH